MRIFVYHFNPFILMFRNISITSSGFALSILFLLIMCPILTTQAQSSIKDSTIAVHLIQGHYSVQIPGGDISDRFGVSSSVGPGYLFKTSRNWVIGAEGGFIFGNNVNNSDNILGNIETEDGNIVDLEGIYATYHFYERGYYVIGKFGKLLSWGKPNPNSGILLGLGGGYLQHKILIDHRDKTAPQITGDYLKGYDELKRGPAINVFAGYLFLGNTRVVNFYTGVDMTMAFTRYVHPYSFSKMEYNSGNFTDIIFSVKLGWMIPAYRRAPKEFYYY